MFSSRSECYIILSLPGSFLDCPACPPTLGRKACAEKRKFWSFSFCIILGRARKSPSRRFQLESNRERNYSQHPLQELLLLPCYIQNFGPPSPPRPFPSVPRRECKQVFPARAVQCHWFRHPHSTEAPSKYSSGQPSSVEIGKIRQSP